MEKAKLIGAGAVLMAVILYLNMKPSGYSAQYITLPSGLEAYCNRQGYREIRGTGLVMDTQGAFVMCDARVGPQWDDQRTSWAGTLLTPEEMDKAQQAKREAEYNSPEAVTARQRAANFTEGRQYSSNIFFSGLRCPNASGPANAAYERMSSAQRETADWKSISAAYKKSCDAEEANNEARDAAEKEVQRVAGIKADEVARAKQDADMKCVAQRMDAVSAAGRDPVDSDAKLKKIWATWKCATDAN